MRRTVTVQCDVDVDLRDIDDEALLEELEDRNEKRGRPMMNITDFEALILRRRMIAEINRLVTVGSMVVTPSMREYFARVYSVDI